MRDSKITFRVSDDLLERVDEIDESRSEIMREALRTYLEGKRRDGRREQPRNTRPTLDAVLRDMVEEVVDETVSERTEGEQSARDGVNVTVNVPEGRRGARDVDADPNRKREDDVEERKTCPQCGEEVDEEHVHCPNCGAKASGRVFCDCGDEVRTDWSFCPSCGRRTPTSHALSNE
jgi:hypothetical protein